VKKEIIRTADGSHTVSVPEMNVTYHSVHGAIQESIHVFIEAGLQYMSARFKESDMLRIFEMGFGTGLNAFLTAIWANEGQAKVHYTAVETSPLFLEEAATLNYADSLGHHDLFQQLHRSNWNDETRLNEFFILEKRRTSLLDFATNKQFHLVYFDAFAPSAQPELWTKEIFEKLHSMLLPGGTLVTYCSKGDVRRAMIAAGFTVEKIPGPPGKREMLRAAKSLN
jgi:tRNA U34 5-methylaminomethyl-2-thiouridine-forming methyltransferase MnmC